MVNDNLQHIGELTTDAENARAHNPRNVGMIVDALHEVGAARSIVIDEDGRILAGNATIEAAALAGIENVKVIEADGETIIAVRRSGLTEEQKKRLALYDNRTAELADWDIGQLAAGLEAGFDLSGLWSELELAELGLALDEPPEDPGAQIDRAEELQEKWQVQRGQIWEIGVHKLMCGDSTSAEDVGRLMGGEKAVLCFTSPPYAQQRDYTHASDMSDWDQLMRGVCAILPMTDDGQVLVNLGLVHRDNEWLPYWNNWIDWMQGWGWRRFAWYVWDQGPGLAGDWAGRLAPAFEFIFHFNRVAVKPDKWVDKLPDSIEINTHGTGIRKADGSMSGLSSPAAHLQPTKIPDSVWRIMRQKARNVPGHPAMFPVELPEFATRCWPGTTYDPFLGSGTTLVACEQTGRVGYGMEIAEKYCSVTLERLTGMGLEPRLVS